jgi:hypothetical protein
VYNLSETPDRSAAEAVIGCQMYVKYIATFEDGKVESCLPMCSGAAPYELN